MPPEEIAASHRPELSIFLTSVMTFRTEGVKYNITTLALQERMRDFGVQCLLY